MHCAMTMQDTPCAPRTGNTTIADVKFNETVPSSDDDEGRAMTQVRMLRKTGSTLSFHFDIYNKWSCSCSAIRSQRFHAFQKAAQITRCTIAKTLSCLALTHGPDLLPAVALRLERVASATDSTQALHVSACPCNAPTFPQGSLSPIAPNYRCLGCMHYSGIAPGEYLTAQNVWSQCSAFPAASRL